MYNLLSANLNTEITWRTSPIGKLQRHICYYFSVILTFKISQLYLLSTKSLNSWTRCIEFSHNGLAHQFLFPLSTVSVYIPIDACLFLVKVLFIFGGLKLISKEKKKFHSSLNGPQFQSCLPCRIVLFLPLILYFQSFCAF